MNTAADKRFLLIHLMPGVNGWNMSSYFLACTVGIMLATFVPGMQPYLLTEFLHIPESEQGLVTGQISLIGEIALLITVGFWGALSDKIGRKPILAAAFLFTAAACYFFPRSETFAELAFARILFSTGFAAYSCIVVVLIADYAQAGSRGKAMGVHGFANGIGALISVFVLLRMPKKLQDQGVDVLSAGVEVYTLVMWVCLAMVCISLIGLTEAREGSSNKTERFLQILRKGLRAARDPIILLSYGAAFVSRGNLAVVGGFLTLWLVQHGTLTLGMTTADAFSRAGMIFGIVNTFTLFGAPLFGVLTDKLNQFKSLMLAMVCAILGYGGTFFVNDPFGVEMIVCAVFIGLGEVGCIVTSSVLIAQRSPADIRGAVVSFFNMCGAFGIMVASIVGGYLFDAWHPTGPFVLFAGFALIVLLWAWSLLRSGVDAREVVV